MKGGGEEMQIRVWEGKSKSRVQFLRSKYDPERKRNIASYIGSQPLSMETLSKDLAAQMTENEKFLAQLWLEQRNRDRQRQDRQDLLTEAPEVLGKLAEAVRKEYVTLKQAELIYRQMDQVAIELKKQGWTKRKTLKG